MVLMGRIFNLLMYALIVCLAIKLMPIYKTTMAIIALMPMSLQIAGSFVYDAYVIAMAFLFTSLVFRLAYDKDKITLKDLIPVTVVLCLLAPAKTIYVVMGLLVFILPSTKFPDKKKAIIAKLAVLLAAVAFWLSTNFASVIYATVNHPGETLDIPSVVETVEEQPELQYPFEMWMAENNPAAEEPEIVYDPNSDLLPNGDSKYYFTIPYMLKNIKATIKLVMRTITTQTGKYLQTVVGTRLGEIVVVDLQASWMWFILIVIVLYLSVTPVKGEKDVYKLPDKLLGLFIFVLITGRVVAAGITWTPINYETIFGIQGRYLLPALPLFMMAIGSKNLQLQKSVDEILLWLMMPANILVLLNVFMIMTVGK